MSPQRIQLRRTKGWRKPEGAIVVARPSRWGNWYRVVPNRTIGATRRIARNGPHLVVVSLDKWGHEQWPQFGTWPNTPEGHREATLFAVELFRRSLEATYVDLDGPLNREHYLGQLRGHDLACWCPLDQPCHADVLLDLANGDFA